ncbi:DMT family transporter [Roseibium suaedae]|uniref:Threonine/homoserine efflux transporter RhtA n=1 Tax=Roseibium suaedae TaxID=735517 RepID=A0A1M7IVH0_9HYPH|nr:DMT family transporter [Roseibium suaedae]SHM44695.1 Threonine/homoserine efflux transporter RhtA [Roseibium suaedae]
MTSDTPGANAATGSNQMAIAFAALLTGAIAMGISPVFVRLADVGSFASAFWRVAAALPLLWVWARMEQPGKGTLSGWSWPVVISGVLFAGDLFFWHLAILNTTIANATFLATLAPVWVLLGSSMILREKVTKPMWLGLLACLLGAAGLVGASLGLDPDRLVGDAYGLATSVFFGAYILATRYVRRSLGPGGLMFRSSLVTSAILAVVALALEPTLLPHSLKGAVALAVIALVSHAGGQGLLAFSLGRLTAGFSALVIFLEAVTAAAVAWAVLGEQLAAMQFLGGALILAGVWFARPRRERS